MFYEITKDMRKNAEYALMLLELGYKAGTKTGKQRAKQLKEDRYLTINDIRNMRNWFARHIHTSYPGFRRYIESDGKDINPGAISWMLWGGSDSIGYINNLTDELNTYFNKKYSKLKLS
jgi:hypothetical protein